MNEVIGNVIVAGISILTFVAYFIRISSKFTRLETEVETLKENDEKRGDKLDDIIKGLSDIQIQVAVINNRLSGFEKDKN